MTNQEIANLIENTAELMEILNENPFKIKAYQKAVQAIESYPEPITDLIGNGHNIKIEGVGKTIETAIEEIIQSGTFTYYEHLKNSIPPGIIELSLINGLGPKKLKFLWQEVGITTIEDLLQACLTGKLAKLKGFGIKTQQAIYESIIQLKQNKSKLLLHHAEKRINEVIEVLKTSELLINWHATGQTLLAEPIIESIELVIQVKSKAEFYDWVKVNFNQAELINQNSLINFYDQSGVMIQLHLSEANDIKIIAYKLVLNQRFLNLDEQELLKIPAELLNNESAIQCIVSSSEPDCLIDTNSIKGVIHAHSTYSDGIHSLSDMAQACINQGYQYLVITDHSKTAAYAGGLSIEKVLEQHKEIELLNEKLKSFKIFKGIESDILPDGSLDYPEEILNLFDVVIASIHSQFKMDEKRATARLTQAIENPYTTILGHLTGRLLLKREGYPVNHHLIIEACARNNVSIELNCNPYRFDMDYKWLKIASENGVKICINPDAHRTQDINYISLGVRVARKGQLKVSNTLNALPLNEFEDFLKNRKAKL